LMILAGHKHYITHHIIKALILRKSS